MAIKPIPPIAILGAGPSGLALGRLLEVANIAFTIYERDESADWASGSGSSGTLDVHAGSGQLALVEAGLIEQFKSLARHDAGTVIANKDGEVFARLGEGGESDRPEIDRKDLRGLLLASIPSERVRWGMRVKAIDRTDDGSMSVRFANGTVESGFKLVVGADGAWSKARSLITSAKPQYSGVFYLTTTISPESPQHAHAVLLAGNGNYMSLAKDSQMCCMKLGSGSYHVGVGLRLPENWTADNAALVENPSAFRKYLVDEHFANQTEAHTSLITHSDGTFYSWPLYAMPTESLSWQNVPGVALIGDAAHVTTPFVGEGVNAAMYDSVQLAQQIVKFGLGDLDRAVAEYEKLMFPRAIDVINRSRESGIHMMGPNAPQEWLDWAFSQ